MSSYKENILKESSCNVEMFVAMKLYYYSKIVEESCTTKQHDI